MSGCLSSSSLGSCKHNSKMLLATLVVLGAVSVLGNSADPWEIKWFQNMPVDHFAYGSETTFNLRYLQNTTNWKTGGPIFFYCGNEGDIEWFAKNTGFMWDIAPEFGAMVVFAEHRYYGSTLPFGNNSYATPANRAYLSSEQALGDYSVLIRYLKRSISGAQSSKVIAFGGSYGGMLAAWFRIKYPFVVDGALASSAPILQFQPITPCNTFADIVTRTFRDSGNGCADAIKRSWGVIQAMGTTTPGQQTLTQNFNLCPNSTISSPENATTLADWLESAWSYEAMVDYPYPANFLNPTPGWPVQESCKHLSNLAGANNATLLKGVYQAVSVYLNYTGNTTCFNLVGSPATADLGDMGWNYQACTEMIMPFCNAASSMYRVSPWNLTQYMAKCRKNYQVNPQPDWVVSNYGGDKLRYATNIIFSNGYLDPWSGGGVTKPVNGAPTIHVINIKQGAHHLDLRSANPADPQSVIDARNLEKKIIHAWIRGTDISAGSSSVPAAFSFVVLMLFMQKIMQ